MNPLARSVYMRAERIFDDDHVDRILGSPDPELKGKRGIELLNESVAGAKMVNDWLHDFEAVDKPVNSFFAKNIDDVDDGFCNATVMFIGLRTITFEGTFWPVEVAVLAENPEYRSYFWRSPIKPAPSWPTPVLNMSSEELFNASSVEEIVRKLRSLIDSCRAPHFLAKDATKAQKVLDDLLTDAGIGIANKVEILRPDTSAGLTQEGADRVNSYLDLSYKLGDPRLEVFRLQRAWWCHER